MSESINITRTMTSPSEPVQLVGSDIRRKRISVRVTKNLRQNANGDGTWWIPDSTTTNVSGMFSYYNSPAWASLKRVPLFDTSNVKYFGSMFDGCSKLTDVPLFDTSSAIDTSYMFEDCSSLVNVPPFNLSSVTRTVAMFRNCVSVQSFPSFNISNVTDISSMFFGCSSITNVNLTNANKVNTISNVFTNCTNLLTLPTLGITPIVRAIGAFSNCSKITVVPAYNFSGITATLLNNAFDGCASLQSILVTGIKVSFSIAQTAMQASAINTLFGNLATIPANSQTVTVTGAPGAATCDRTIATGKGWIVA